MYLFLRNYFNRVFPVRLRWWLVRNLSSLEIFLAKNLRGIEKLWLSDPEFYENFKKIEKRSLLDVRKAYILYSLARNCANLYGNYAELGVFRGAGARLMSVASKGGKKILLFDTFEGLPNIHSELDEDWKKSNHMKNNHFKDVVHFLNEQNYIFYKGYFPESATEIAEEVKFAFIHIDFDLYQSTLDALVFFYGKMVSGGQILIDDYGVSSCAGVEKAVRDFFCDKPEVPIPTLFGQCIITKQ